LANLTAVFDMEDKISNKLKRVNQNLRQVRETADAMKTALKGTEHTLASVTSRLQDSTTHFKAFNKASNPAQATMAFKELEKGIRKSRNEMKQLGFGRLEHENKKLEDQLHKFANIRFKKLQDEIKGTENALKQMQNSADSHKYVNEIKRAQDALAIYKRELQDSDVVKKFAQVHGYELGKAFGRDVIYKPFSNSMDAISGRLNQFFNRDLAGLANTTYKSIDNSINRIVGVSDSVDYQKKQVMKLQGAYMMLTTTVTTFGLMGVAALTGLTVAIMKYYEDGLTKFQQQTITPTIELKDYDGMIERLHIEVGKTPVEIGVVLAELKNKGTKDNLIESYAEQSLQFADAWDLQAKKVVNNLDDIQKKIFKGNRDTSVNATALAMTVSKGDMAYAIEHMTTYNSLYEKLTSGQKVSNGEVEKLARKAGELQFTEGTRAEKNKQIEKYVKGQVDEFERLNKLDGVNAFMTITDDAARPVEKMMKALRAVGVMFKTYFAPLGPMVSKIADGIRKMAESATAFLKANPGIATFVAYLGAGLVALVAIIGVLSPIAFGLMVARNHFKGLADAIGVMGKGTAIADPKVRMLASRIGMFRKALLGLPSMVLSLFPAMLTMLRAAPLGLLKFAADFVKINPLFLALSGIAYLMYQNWDRIAPLFERIKDAFKLAIEPLKEFFDATSNSEGAKGFWDAIDKIAVIAGNTLVNALEVVTPLFEAFAKIVNGDYAGASKSLEEVAKKMGELLSDFFNDFDFQSAFEFGVDIGVMIVKGMASALKEGLKDLFDFNKEAFASGDASKIGTAIAADILAGVALMMATGALTNVIVKGVKNTKAGVDTVVGTGKKVVDGTKAVAHGTAATAKAIYSPIQTTKNIANTVRNTNVKEAYTAYRGNRNDGKGRISSAFNGYRTAGPVKPVPTPIVKPTPVPKTTRYIPKVPMNEKIGNGLTSLGKGATTVGKGLISVTKKLAMPVAIGIGAHQIATAEAGKERQKTTGRVGGALAGGLAGGKLGAMGGAAIGTMILPGIGTAIGGALGGIGGGIAGSMAGSKGGEAIGDKWESIKGFFTGNKQEDKVSASSQGNGAEKVTKSVSPETNWEKTKNGASDAYKYIADKSKEAWDKTSDWFSDMGGKISDKSSEIKGKVTDKFNELKDKAINKFTEIKDGIVNKFTEIKDGAVNKFNEVKDGIVNKVMETKDKVLKFFSEIPEKIDTFFAELPEKIAYWIGYAVGWAETKFDELVTYVQGVPDKLVAWFSGIGDKIGVWFTDTKDKAILKFDELVTWVQGVPDKLVAWFSGIGDKIGVWFTDTKDKAILKFDELVTWVQGVPDRIAAWFATQGDKIAVWFDDVKTKAKGKFDELVEWVQGVPDRVAAWFSTMGDKIAVWFSDTKTKAIAKFDELVEWVGGVPDKIAAWFSSLPGKIQGYWTSIKEGAVQSFNDITSALGEMIGGIPGKLYSAASSAFSAAMSIGTSIVNGIKSGWNSVVGSIGGALKWALDKATGGMNAVVSLGRNIGDAFNQGRSDGRGGAKDQYANGGIVGMADRNGFAGSGIINRPHLVDGGRGIAGEAGAEAIIPLSESRKSVALSLWRKTGRILGVFNDNSKIKQYANGGVTGSPSDVRTPKDNNDNIIRSMSSKSDATKTVATTMTKIDKLVGEVHIHNEADEDRFIDKLRQMLEAEIIGGGEGVHE